MIRTPHLEIVPFSKEYLTPRYINWLNDPDVVRYSDQRFRTHTLETCKEYWQSFKNSENYFWAVVARDAGLGHIGNLNAYVDTNHSVADVGILIGEKRVWKQGYGLEAWFGVCDYLFRKAGMRKVTAGTLSANKAMISIMRRSGMVKDGRRIRHCLCEGQEQDMIHWALFRERWLKQYPKGPFCSISGKDRLSVTIAGGINV